jgi:hypothetical protein
MMMEAEGAKACTVEVELELGDNASAEGTSADAVELRL